MTDPNIIHHAAAAAAADDIPMPDDGGYHHLDPEASSSRSCATVLVSVDFPDPEGPQMPTISGMPIPLLKSIASGQTGVSLRENGYGRAGGATFGQHAEVPPLSVRGVRPLQVSFARGSGWLEPGFGRSLRCSRGLRRGRRRFLGDARDGHGRATAGQQSDHPMRAPQRLGSNAPLLSGPGAWALLYLSISRRG